MTKTLVFRFVMDLCIFFAIINGWWFVALPLIVIGALAFSFFLESALAGIAYDALFGLVPEMGIWGYAGTLVSTLIVILTAILKKNVR